MNEDITLPAWLFFPVAMLVIGAAPEHLLLPTLRKVVRWRAQAVLNELGSLCLCLRKVWHPTVAARAIPGHGLARIAGCAAAGVRAGACAEIVARTSR